MNGLSTLTQLILLVVFSAIPTLIGVWLGARIAIKASSIYLSTSPSESPEHDELDPTEGVMGLEDQARRPGEQPATEVDEIGGLPWRQDEGEAEIDE